MEELSDLNAANHRFLLFFGYIVQDNREGLISVLTSASASMKHSLLNEQLKVANQRQDVKLDEHTISYDCDDLVDQFSVRYSLSLAAVYGSVNCFEELIQQGANPFLQDDSDNNLVHILVLSESRKLSDRVLKMYDLILSHLRLREERQKLLLHVNDAGLNPLEQAAKLCCAEMFRSILYTEGVYRTVVTQQGIVVTNKFQFGDNTDNDDRFCSSFLWQLTSVGDTVNNSIAVNKILRIPAVHRLIDRRFRFSLPYILIWALLRSVIGLLFFYTDIDMEATYHHYACDDNQASRDNVTEYYTDYVYREYLSSLAKLPISAVIQIIYGVFYACGTILFDIAEFFYVKRNLNLSLPVMWRMFHQPFLINTNCYRMAMVILSVIHISMATSILTPDVQEPGALKVIILPMMYLVERTFTLYSMLYFVQLMPFVGYYVIGYHKMLTALTRFALLQLVIIYLFSTMFRHVNVFFCRPSEFSCESDGGFYNTFTMMLNMVTVVPEDKCLEIGRISLQFLHIFYVFIVAVMTINYLIAVMTTVYNNLSYYESSAVTLHRIHIFLVVERRNRLWKAIFPGKWFGLIEPIDVIVREIDENFDRLQQIGTEHVNV